MRLAWNRYGKARVRLVKVRRQQEPHELSDLTLDIQLEGDFEPVYADGDNTLCVATDTMKNTVYALAREHDVLPIETFADRLTTHFVAQPQVTRTIVSVREHPWRRLSIGDTPHPHAFMQPGGEQWTTVVTREKERTTFESGLRDLVVLKTTDSGFAGFPRDRYTTLPETADRILATSITASWRYQPAIADFSVRDVVRTALTDAFASHHSRSVQETLHAMAAAALSRCADVDAITLSLPNRHHLLVDLRPFGLDNPNEIFVATDQPYGLIEATLTR